MKLPILSNPRSGSHWLFSSLLNNIPNIDIVNIPEKCGVKGIVDKRYELYHIHYWEYNKYISCKNIKGILIYREDLLRQSISLGLSYSTNIWNVKNNNNSEINEKIKIHIKNNINNYLFDIIEDRKKLYNLIIENNIKIKIITYETLLSNFDEVIKDCIKFLFDMEILEVNTKSITSKLSNKNNEFLYNVCKLDQEIINQYKNYELYIHKILKLKKLIF